MPVFRNRVMAEIGPEDPRNLYSTLQRSAASSFAMGETGMRCRATAVRRTVARCAAEHRRWRGVGLAAPRGGVGMGYSHRAGVVIVCDGTEAAARRIARVLCNEPATGVMRHANAGYAKSIDVAKAHSLKLPMSGS